MFFIVLAISFITDILSKFFAKTHLQENIAILGDLFFLRYAENRGIAFSFELPFLKIITIILIIIIFYYYWTQERSKQNKITDISFGLILGGALGNGIERVLNDFVIDFIGVKYFSIFNLADTWISIGALLYICYLYRQGLSASDKVTIQEEYGN